MGTQKTPERGIIINHFSSGPYFVFFLRGGPSVVTLLHQGRCQQKIPHDDTFNRRSRRALQGYGMLCPPCPPPTSDEGGPWRVADLQVAPNQT